MKEKESPGERQNQEDAARVAIIGFIRSRSEAGQLVTAEDIRGEFLGIGVPIEKEDQLPEFEGFLKETVTQSEELKEIVDGKGVPHYYVVGSMAETYAGLLIRKGQDPLLLVTDVVRENSQRYPRPVPLGMFEDPPFELTPEEISSCLERMADQEAYRDIQRTTTSIGTVFLFSTLYLEPDYASFLAEWIDVGQVNSP